MFEATHLMLIASSILYAISICALITRRNLIQIAIALEILIDAANMNFIAFSKMGHLIDPVAHAIVITSIVIGGCVETAILALAVYVYKHYRTLDVRELRRLRW